MMVRTLWKKSRFVLLVCMLSWGTPHGLGSWNDGGTDRDFAMVSHAALARPDGVSHRGDKIVGKDIDDPRVLAELSRRFQAAKQIAFIKKGNDVEIQGTEDFELRQEYFLRLLDHYLFEKDRLTGLTKAEIERIFGPGHSALVSNENQLTWSGGRDSLVVTIQDERVVYAFYAIGY